MSKKTKNKIRSILAVMLSFLTIITMGIPAFAYSPPEKEEAVIEAEEELSLTPEGNLELVDDIDEDMSDHLQFMTVVTKDGNYFYIIVDRSQTSNNVHFLNKVDEADLLSLLDEEERAEYELPEVIEKPAEESLVEPEELPDMASESEMGNSLMLLIVMALIAGGVAGGYYLVKIRPSKKHDNPEEFEFDDDEEYEYVNEDEEE